jgi:hypothetical protein
VPILDERGPVDRPFVGFAVLLCRCLPPHSSIEPYRGARG